MWVVELNPGPEGNTARIVIDAATGIIQKKHYVMSRQEAVERAKRVAEAEGWPWGDVPGATETAFLGRGLPGSGPAWVIRANRSSGGGAFVGIDAETGAVIEKGFLLGR